VASLRAPSPPRRRGRVEGGEQVHHFGAAHLPDHHPVRSHAQRLAHELAHRHLADPFYVGGACHQSDHVRVLRLQLGGVLHAHNAFTGVDLGQQRGEQRRLART